MPLLVHPTCMLTLTVTDARGNTRELHVIDTLERVSTWIEGERQLTAIKAFWVDASPVGPFTLIDEPRQLTIPITHLLHLRSYVTGA